MGVVLFRARTDPEPPGTRTRWPGTPNASAAHLNRPCGAPHRASSPIRGRSTRRGSGAPHLDPVFRDRFGYELEPYKVCIDEHPDVRYDYRKTLSDAAIDGFFKPYAEICRELGAVSRVQCHGAPTDLLAAFALVDVPESEALLFETFYSAIPGSAAALASRPVVTCETFTCIYGYEPWPAPFAPSRRGESGGHEAHGGCGLRQRRQSHRLARHAVQCAVGDQHLLRDHARRSGQRVRRPASGLQRVHDGGRRIRQAGQDLHGRGGVPAAGRPLDTPHAARVPAGSGRQLLLGNADR